MFFATGSFAQSWNYPTNPFYIRYYGLAPERVFPLPYGTSWPAPAGAPDSGRIAWENNRPMYKDNAGVWHPFQVGIPTLQQVTTSGNSTTDDITLSSIWGAPAQQIRLKVSESGAPYVSIYRGTRGVQIGVDSTVFPDLPYLQLMGTSTRIRLGRVENEPASSLAFNWAQGLGNGFSDKQIFFPNGTVQGAPATAFDQFITRQQLTDTLGQRMGTAIENRSVGLQANSSFGITGTARIATNTTPAAPLQVGTLPSYANLSIVAEGNIQTVPAISGNHAVVLDQLRDSLNTRAPNSLNGLMTYPDSVLQPSDTPLRAFEKIQGQFNAIIGRYIENQDTVFQLGKFTLSGASKIRSTTQRPNLTITKGPADTTYAIITFDDYANNRLGYIGAPSFTDPNSMTLAVLRSRMYYITRDTASHIFGNYNGSTSAFYTYMRNGHWRFYRQSANPFDHDATNYDPSYTMQVDGQLRFDTLRALNFTSATTPITSTTGKFLSVNASGDVGLYDLRASSAWLNGSQAQYTVTSDTMDVISQATNYNYRIKLRRTGGIMYDAFFIKGSNGLTGIGTVNPSSTLTVKGSVSLTHTVTTGNLTLTDAHNVVRVANSAHAITLPSAASAYSGGEGRVYTIVNYNTGGSATISSVQVYGAATTSIPNNTSWTIQSDGTNWILISRSN